MYFLIAIRSKSLSTDLNLYPSAVSKNRNPAVLPKASGIFGIDFFANQ